MAFTETYDFTEEDDYTYDDTAVQISAGASLIYADLADQDLTQTFTSDAGFTYDGAKAEFIGGVVRQKSQVSAEATCFAGYTTDINLTWGDGVLTGSAIGGAAVAGGVLVLTGGTAKYVDYSATDNADSQQVGCIRFIYTPAYNNTPIANRALFSIAKVDSDNDNSIYLYHGIGSIIKIISYDSTGGFINAAASFGAFLPVASTSYEFELNYDFTTGAQRLFIDGIQSGVTITDTGTRDSSIALFRIGSNVSGTAASDATIDNVMFFSAVQHTANYTPAVYASDTKYVASTVVLPEMSYTTTAPSLLLETFATTETDTPKYTVQIARSGDYLYWDGAAWATSDGTYAQATDATTFNTNSDDIDVVGNAYAQFKILFDDAAIQSSVDLLTATLTEQQYSITNETVLLEALPIEGLLTFTTTTTITGSDAIKWILKKSGSWYYHDGSDWVVSDGTYAQSNTATEVNTNAATFTDIGVASQFKAFLHSNDGTTTPTLTQLVTTYDFFGGIIVDPSLCEVFGYLYDSDGDVLPDVTVIAELDYSYAIYNQDLIVNKTRVTATTDAIGYWDMSLVETDSMDGARYNFTFYIDGVKATFIRQVPNVISKNFSELVE